MSFDASILMPSGVEQGLQVLEDKALETGETQMVRLPDLDATLFLVPSADRLTVRRHIEPNPKPREYGLPPIFDLVEDPQYLGERPRFRKSY